MKGVAAFPIKPFKNVRNSTATVPGSKSISNRALMLAFLCRGEILIRNLLDSDDTRALREGFIRLGIETRSAPEGIFVTGCGGLPPRPRAEIDVLNAGTVARFLPAALSLCSKGEYLFDGSAAMRKRPMAGLLDSLEELGAEVECAAENGHFPFVLRPSGWSRNDLEVDASRSSQILSGLLIAATRAPRSMTFSLRGDTVSKPFVEMTLRMIVSFGGNAVASGRVYTVCPGLQGPSASTYAVEPDATAASYFFALPIAAGGCVRIDGFPDDSLQGDLRFLSVLEQGGLEIVRHGNTLETTFNGDFAYSGSDFFLNVDFNAFSDTFLTLAALAPILPGPVRIRGIGHTRHQESDRITATATELRKLGQEVEETEDSLTIRPNRSQMRSLSADRPVEIDTYEDHRVAMSFGILGCHDLHGDGRRWIAIRNPGCSGKTFPGFFEELARLRSFAESTLDV